MRVLVWVTTYGILAPVSRNIGFSKTIKKPTQWILSSLDIHASTCCLFYSIVNQRSRSNCALLMISCQIQDQMTIHLLMRGR